MKSTYIDIKGYWGVAVGYDLQPLDEYRVRSTLMSLGIRGEELEEAISVLFGKTNSGLCISIPEKRMSLIYIGDATGEDQWWDTLAHELLDHCQYAIRMYYGVSQGSEDSAWLTGYLMRKAVQQIGEPCL
ncbi:MAG: hypothetical protein IJ588_08735 [Prevotella sp.]|nr:hypothetical protein [Prevotella sp.]